MKTKILIIEHDPAAVTAIQHALKIGRLNFITEMVQSEKDFEKALHRFKPDLILSNYTSPMFDGMAIFGIKEKLVPQTPFIFVSESVGEENAVKLIKNGATDLVLKERLCTLTDKVNLALKQAALSKLNTEHKQSEENLTQELWQNNCINRSLFENSINGILLAIIDGPILSANPAACEIFKMTEQESIDAGRLGITDSTDPRLKVLIEERQRKGSAKGELTLVRKNGSKFPAEIASTVFKDAYGEKKTSLIIKDITERKETKQKLAQSTNDLRQALNDLTKILDFSSELICSCDEKGRFVRVNAASESILGYKPQELIGKKYMDFIFPDDNEKTISADTATRSDMQLTMFENRYIHKNGSIVPLLWSAIWDDDYKQSYCIAKDVTDKKKLEQAFEIERQRFHDLYLQAPSCMGILKGPNHVYELANNLYLQLIDKKNIIGKTIKEVLPELEAQGILEFLDTVYQTGETFSANEMLVKFDYHGNGKLVDKYLNFIYQPHRDSDGTIDGIFFFANDVTEQVLSRKKIEENVLRYSSLIEQASDAICITDVSMKIIEVNRYACEKLGYSRAEIFQLSIGDFFLEEDLKSKPLKIDALKAGNTVRSERRIKRKDGTLIDMELSAKMLKNGGTLLFARDVTENKKARQALIENEKKYRYLFENNPMPMWVIDLITFEFLDVNKMAIQQYGYSREEFLSMTALDIRPEEDKELFIKSSDSSEINETNFNRGIWNHLKKNGTIIPVEIIAHEIIYEGIPARFILSNDITHRRKAEESLLQSESRLKDAQAIARLGSWELNFETGIAMWSDETCRIYGLSPKDNKQTYSSWISFIHPDDIDNVMTIINESRRTLSNHAFSNRIILKNGTIKHIETECRFEFDQNGKLVGLFGIAHDVTEIILAKLQLEQQNRELAFQNEEKEKRTIELSITNKELIKTNTELDRFVYSVSHDLRSPLTSILGLLSFIEGESQEPDTLEHAKMIHKSINRMDEFIKNILSYSRNNRTGLEIETFSIQETAIAIVNSLQSMKEAKDVLYEIDIKEEQPFYTDMLRFNILMENLVSNAIKYHKKDISGSFIKITGQSNYKQLQLTIADNGIGIAPAYHQKIFDMFFRLSGKKDGSGIGLYIVKDTVEILQGSIEIQSEIGVGTTFIITLKNLKP